MCVYSTLSSTVSQVGLKITDIGHDDFPKLLSLQDLTKFREMKIDFIFGIVSTTYVGCKYLFILVWSLLIKISKIYLAKFEK